MSEHTFETTASPAATQANAVFKTTVARVTEDYLVQQVEALKASEYWRTHKARIADFDRVYGGDLSGLVPGAEENTLDKAIPYVENKVKNATHDIKRLAMQSRGTPRFVKEGEDDRSLLRAKIRQNIVETLWREGRGDDLEGQLYLDLIAGGFAALAVYNDGISDYPQFLRLNPRLAYPTVLNSRLLDLVYIETMKERSAARLFPDAGLDESVGNRDTVDVVLIFTPLEIVQGICHKRGNTMRSEIIRRWEHGLGEIPVAFRALETADDAFRGLLDQLRGPLLARNRAVRLMIDYLEDMVNAPYFEIGVLNADRDLPGPDTIYHGDPAYDGPGSPGITRVAPGAPAGAVFGLLGYLDAQEASEGFQPPARVGIIRQSQASGSFVESTQGSLSSVVIEVQRYIAGLRRDAGRIAMKIDEHHLDREKPLLRPVGNKTTYRPSKDIKGWYHHEIVFGAAAGLDRREADQRILQHLGAGLIDPSTAREQIDYISSDTNIQDDVDRSLLRKVEFQKLVSDPSVTFADLAEIDMALGRGVSWREALEQVVPRLLERQQQAVAAAAETAGPVPEEGRPVEEEAAALASGATRGVTGVEAGAIELAEFAPPLFTQVIAS